MKDRLFTPEAVRIVDHMDSKSLCLEFMCQLLVDTGSLELADRFLDAVKGREEVMSTGIGKGVAIPHARDATVKELKIALCLIRRGIDFESLDKKPVNLVFLTAVPSDANREYMNVLKGLSEYLRHDDKRLPMMEAKDEKELFEYARQIESQIHLADSN
ncbi:MAG: PTS sugar transporter subunit IIA [Candidatus Cloacimonadaceae bacterium]|jgi:PTS system nitrogen regulatory IIA component